MAKAVIKVDEDDIKLAVIYCPACNSNHTFLPYRMGQEIFNGDVYEPTFKSTINSQEIVEDIARKNNCHFQIEKGYIRYLSNCKHALYGRTVELPDYND